MPSPAKIGIFWVIKNQVIGGTTSLEIGDETLFGMVDSPLSHWSLWENPDFIKKNPITREEEYQKFPRGRVIFDQEKKTFLIYLDKKLIRPPIQKKITAFFSLENQEILWKKDLHYTTDPREIKRLFE